MVYSIIVPALTSIITSVLIFQIQNKIINTKREIIELIVFCKDLRKCVCSENPETNELKFTEIINELRDDAISLKCLRNDIDLIKGKIDSIRQLFPLITIDHVGKQFIKPNQKILRDEINALLNNLNNLKDQSWYKIVLM